MELNDEFTYFKGKPGGNSPEMMPLDNCLNKDIHESVSQHVLVSLASGGSLDKDDVRFFGSYAKEGSTRIPSTLGSCNRCCASLKANYPGHQQSPRCYGTNSQAEGSVRA